MIYIYTISSDQSCNYIIDWLIQLKVHYRRVNSDSFYSFFNFSDDELQNNDVHWFWKWKFPDFHSNEYYSDIYNNNVFNSAMDAEYRSLFRMYFDNCKGKIINHPHYINIDKLTQIKIAKRCGMSVPPTIITSSKEQLKLFITKHDKVITKNLISSPVFIFENKMCIRCKLLPICMGPCIQKVIENKNDDIRKVCYLNFNEINVKDYIISIYKDKKY